MFSTPLAESETGQQPDGLAKSFRYTSRFHRQQEIMTYAKHFDSFETYTNLSKFLCANYRQALEILKAEGALQTWMRQEKVDSMDRFHEWLVEEKAYLESLKDATKTNEESFAMNYAQKLMNLSTSQAEYQVAAAEARQARVDDAAYTPSVSGKDWARHHAQEKMEKNLDRMQELEETLGIVERWMTESPKWMSQTGCKMRKHIAKALQARSKAVKNTIERYNDTMGLLHPPMPSLTWEQVVEYTFMADFDITRDTRAEILCAQEEIKHLVIEIHHVVTWIRNKNMFLHRMEKNLRVTDEKGEEQAEEDRQMAVFQKLTQMPGFTGTLQCGVAMEHLEVRCRLHQLHVEQGGEDARVAAEGREEEMNVDDEEEVGEAGEDDGGHKAREEAVSGLLYQISMLATNDGLPGDGADD
ncbi:hypothetical protein DFH08DRAFT_963835 [Mycena albidolilacea]|uniref:Uncharacterized protein n=1 Tax=Mycena albidolilacea TaxID=1033008 RepID=A0AAD7EN10_9AGAR|nr:hypothetical protein DFH08DRAFT_963835 [Mycena albidolilacea]